MSKPDSFYDEMSNIKDEYIKDAMEQSAPAKSGNIRFVLEAVACAAIICGFIALSFVLKTVSGPGNAGASTDTESVREQTDEGTEQIIVACNSESAEQNTDTAWEQDGTGYTEETSGVTTEEESDNGIISYPVDPPEGPSIFEMLGIKPFDVLLPTIYHGRLEYVDHTLNWLSGEEGENAPVFYEGVLELNTEKALAAYHAAPDEVKESLKEYYPEIDPSHSYPTLTIRVYNKENAEKDLHYIDLREKRDYDFEYLPAGEDPFGSYIDKALFKPEQLWVGAVKSRITDNGFHMYIECGDHIVEYKGVWDDIKYVRSIGTLDVNLCIMITSSRYISSRIDRSKIEEDPAPVKEIKHKIIELDAVLDVIRKRVKNNYYPDIEDAIQALQYKPDKGIEYSPYLQWDYIVHGTEKLLSDYIRDDDVVEYIRISARYKAVFYYKVMPDGEIFCSLIYKASEGGAVPDELTVANVCSSAVPLAEFEAATGIKFDFKYDQAKIAEYLERIYSHPDTTKTTYRIGDTADKKGNSEASKRLAELGVEEIDYSSDKYGLMSMRLLTLQTTFIGYQFRSYPVEYDYYGDSKSTLTNIIMRGEELKICGISSESSFDEFEEVFTSLGFEVTRSGVNITASACEGGLTVRLVKQYENNGETVPSKLYFSLQTITRAEVMF